MGTRMANTAAGVTAATVASLGHRAADHWSATRAAQLHTTVWTRGGGPGNSWPGATVKSRYGTTPMIERFIVM